MSNQVEIVISEVVQPSIEIIDTGAGSVEVLQPAASTVTEVNVPGPQGPAREALNVKVDTDTLGTIYVGQSPNGSADSSSVWTITRSTYNSAGVRLTKGVADNVTWTGRAGHTYT